MVWRIQGTLARSIACLFLIILLPACLPKPPSRLAAPWDYTDVRQLGIADALRPSLDLLALYTRQRGAEFQVRLDFLDLSPDLDYDVYLALDSQPGGTAQLPFDEKLEPVWDLLLEIPANGRLQANVPGIDGKFETAPGPGMRVLRDPVLDQLIISMDARSLPGGKEIQNFDGVQLQVWVTSPGLTTPADSLGPVRNTAPPPAPARVLFAFWNSFPAYTPAQALRRWDGAHTGPLGGRHGLYNLLRAAKNSRIPVILLDLKEPQALAALQYAGGLSLVKNTSARGLLILPQVFPDARYGPSSPSPIVLAENLAATNRSIDQKFGLHATPFLFFPNGLPPDGFPYSPARMIFYPVANADPLAPQTIHRWKNLLAAPLPGYATDRPSNTQVDLGGFTIEARRALAKAASSNTARADTLIILGGDLPGTAWGNPQAARAAFQYINAHPWIQPLDANQLVAAFPSQKLSGSILESLPEIPMTSIEEQSLLERLQAAPPNLYTQAAWDAYQAMYARVYPYSPLLPELRRNYLGQVDILLEASHWLACGQTDLSECPPRPLIDCSTDPDQDGTAECTFASKDFLGFFELQGGTLSSAFTRSGSSAHQIIGPSYQFSSGQSDPSTWDLAQGILAEPSTLPGAFVDDGVLYQPEIREEALILRPTQENTGSTILSKTFQLTPEGLRADYHISASQQTQISLVFDPWERFSTAWEERYRSVDSPQGWIWQLVDPERPDVPVFQVQVRTSGILAHHDFAESLQFQGRPEDPNQDYPPGHFLPFPVALAQVSANDDFYIELNWGK